MTKCQCCKGLERTHIVKIIDCSCDKKLSRRLPKVYHFCDSCLSATQFLCPTHNRPNLAVYDNRYETGKEIHLFSVCMECVQDDLDDLDTVLAAHYVSELYEFAGDMAEQLVKTKLFGVPDQPSFERRVLFNLIVAARLEGVTLEQQLAHIMYVAKTAEREAEEEVNRMERR